MAFKEVTGRYDGPALENEVLAFWREHETFEKALAYEIERQIELLEDGGEVVQETRHWDEAASRSLPGRTKEDADDYRYFPDPDLAPLRQGYFE